MKYITKPCEIEAVEWTGKNATEILQFTNTENVNIVFGIPVISTFNGEMRADVGDYIIRGLRGEYYPCKPDVFHAKYEPCEEQEQREEQEQHKMNKQEKEDLIIRKTYELNRIFVNYKVSKDKQKAMNEQMNEVKKIHRVNSKLDSGNGGRYKSHEYCSNAGYCGGINIGIKSDRK